MTTSENNGALQWIVRTESGEILGPYLESELILLLDKQVFDPSAEIARSGDGWISIRTLLKVVAELPDEAPEETNGTKPVSGATVVILALMFSVVLYQAWQHRPFSGSSRPLAQSDGR